MPIYIYYHITLLNDWKSLLKEQCNRIVFSGLYDRVERIKCYAIDPQDKMKKKCAAFLKRFGEKLVLEKTTKSGNEWFTLRHVKETCRENDRVLYIHTKGLLENSQTTFHTFIGLLENSRRWIRHHRCQLHHRYDCTESYHDGAESLLR